MDTTVLVYAVAIDHPLRRPCRQLIVAIRDREAIATTTPEVIQEFTHVRARRRDRRDAVSLARDYATILSPLMTVGADDLDSGLDLFQSHEPLGAFDSVLAAAARRNGADFLVSADASFGAVDAPRHVDPAAPEFLQTLGLYLDQA